MAHRNPSLARVHPGYLFHTIAKHKQALLQKHPNAHIINLGIGDTTEPIAPHIVEAFKRAAERLGTAEGYSGYGPAQGDLSLREQIARVFYQDLVEANEIFISDGAKCDIGRLQLLFGPDTTVSVQDPAYPAYVDTSVISGKSTEYAPTRHQYQGITYLPCRPENVFFPDLESLPPPNLIYFCSPNNPTGAVATIQQLTRLVQYAQEHKTIILFDSAYAMYIQEPSLPKSIFEIPEARKVAIEIGSFSKIAGFTGIRLGWSIVPKELSFEDGSSVKQDWTRIWTTFFNGASSITQAGGRAALEQEGLQQVQKQIRLYLDNAKILKEAIENKGYLCYGGTNTPYLWTKFPNQNSWEAFQKLLEKAHLVTTPGSGFGPSGEGFVRFSAFGKQSDIKEAATRLKKAL